MGWIYESIYCTIRAKKWENRGFLYGPLCPIYGAGGVAITAIADLISVIVFIKELMTAYSVSINVPSMSNTICLYFMC